MVMIGIDPHKRTHTAVAVDDARGRAWRNDWCTRGRVRCVSSSRGPMNSIASRGRGRLSRRVGSVICMAQQLLAAGEQVVDIPAMFASRVRLLGSGQSEKNDPNDARSVAIAALRGPTLVAVRVEDHTTVGSVRCSV